METTVVMPVSDPLETLVPVVLRDQQAPVDGTVTTAQPATRVMLESPAMMVGQDSRDLQGLEAVAALLATKETLEAMAATVATVQLVLVALRATGASLVFLALMV